MNQSDWQNSLEGYLEALGRLCSPYCQFGVISFPLGDSLDSTIKEYSQEMLRRSEEIGRTYCIESSEKITYQELLNLFESFIFKNLIIDDSKRIAIIKDDITDKLCFVAEADSPGSYFSILKKTFYKLEVGIDKNEICIVIPLTRTAVFLSLHVHT